MATKKFTVSSTAGIANNYTLVQGGKAGFTTLVGTVSAICPSYSFTTPEIVLNVANLHLIYDDIFAIEHSSVLSNVFIQVPIKQYSNTQFNIGATGYFNKNAYTTLEVKNTNKTANTITVYNKTVNGVSIVDSILTPPMRLSLFQSNVLAQNTVFVYGSTKQVKGYFEVDDISGTFVFPLKTRPALKSEITILVDDELQETFIWPYNSNTAQVAINLNGDSSNLVYYINTIRVPAIEANDKVSFISDANQYRVLTTTYVPDEPTYNASLAVSGFYKIRLSNNIFNVKLNQPLVNISTDLQGNVSNLSGNVFWLTYDDSYPYKYSLSNSGIYYLYDKNSVVFTQGVPDAYGNIKNLDKGQYIVSATNINRFNRASTTVSGVIEIEALKLSKVKNIELEEEIIIDTVGGATINATVKFPRVDNDDVSFYELLYRTVPTEGLPSPYTTINIQQPESGDVSVTINNLVRGPQAGYNTLEIIVTPIAGTSIRGYSTNFSHSLQGKLTKPTGLINVNAAQQGNNILFTWQFVRTADGFILDPDANEIEIREYPGPVDISSQETLSATWGIALTAATFTAVGSNFQLPVTKFGVFTYLLRVRDTSNQESDTIAAVVVSVERTIGSKVYKNYNDFAPGVSYIIEDGVSLPTSNIHPEASFTSFSETITNGLITSISSNTDNSNGSSVGFSIVVDSDYLTTGQSTTATYITPIRDMGKIIKGTIRINPLISISPSNFILNNQYEEVFSGISDFHPSTGLGVNTYVLVDNAFGGLGHVLGFNNANAAPVTYNSFHKTLTSGGALGNVYAIINPGQFANDVSNANSFAYISSVLNGNAIVLSNVYFANGVDSLSNSFANLTRAGNTYKLVNLYQFADPELRLTFLGPSAGVSQNIFVRYATDNVFYTAAANGVVGFPNHGNVNGNAFIGATSNADLGFKNYVSGLLEFRYMQVKLELINRLPEITAVELQSLTYDVDIPEKTFRKVVAVNSVNGVTVDYSEKGFIEPPSITTTLVNADISYTASVYNPTENNCNIKVFTSSNSSPVSTQTVYVQAVGI